MDGDDTPMRPSAARPPLMRPSLIPGTPSALTPRRVNIDKENYVTKSDYHGLKVKLNRMSNLLADAKHELEDTRSKLHKKEMDYMKLYKEKRHLEMVKGTGSRTKEERVAQRDRVQVLSVKVKALQSRLMQKEGDKKEVAEHFSQAVTQFQGELRDMEAALEEETSQREGLERQVEQLEADLESSKASYEAGARDVRRVQQELADAKTEAEENSERASVLIQEIDAAMQREGTLKAEAEKAAKERGLYKDEAERLQQELRAANDAVTQLKKDNMAVVEEKAKLAMELKQVEFAKQCELEAANQTAERHRQQVEQLLESEREGKQRLSGMVETVSALQAELAAKTQQVTDGVEQLGQLDAVVGENKRLHEHNRRFTEELERYEEQLAAKTHECRTMQKDHKDKIDAMQRDFRDRLHQQSAEAHKILANHQKTTAEALEEYALEIEDKDNAMKAAAEGFNKTIDELRQENDSLAAQCTQLTSECEGLQEVHASLTEDLQHYEVEFAAQQDAVRAIEQECDERLEARTREFEAQLHQQIAEAHAAFDMQQKQAKDAVAQLEAKASHDMEKLAHDLSTMRISGERLVSEKEDLQRTHTATEEQLAARNAELTAARREHAQQIDAINARHTEITQQLTSDAATADQRIEELVAEQAVSRKELASTKRKLEAEQNKVEALESKSKALSEAHGHLARAKEEVAKLREQITALEEQLRTANRSKESVLGNLEEADAKVAGMVEELAEGRKEAAALKTELKKLRAQKANSQLKAGHSELLDKLSVLEAELSAKEDEVAEAMNHLAAVEEERAEEHRGAKELQERVAALEDELDATREQAKVAMDALKEQVLEFQETNEEAGTVVEKKAKQIKKLMKELDAKNEELDELEDQKEAAEKVVRELEVSTREIVQKYKDKLDTKNKEISSLKGSLKRTVTEANEKIDTLHQENLRMEGIANQYRNELEEFGRKHERRMTRASLHYIRNELANIDEDGAAVTPMSCRKGTPVHP